MRVLAERRSHRQFIPHSDYYIGDSAYVNIAFK